MLIELKVKMVDEFTTEEIQRYTKELHNLRIMENEEDASVSEEEFWASKRKYCYQPLVIHVEDCLPFSKYDKGHVILNYGGESYMAQIKYEEFKSIYESITGVKIRLTEEFKFVATKTK